MVIDFLIAITILLSFCVGALIEIILHMRYTDELLKMMIREIQERLDHHDRS